MSYIYRILCWTTGKVYIGSAIDFERRIAVHKYHLRKKTHPNKYLQNAWNKYGEDDFDFMVVEYVNDKAKIYEREQYWMNNLNCFAPGKGFNISKIAGGQLGFKHSAKSIAKMSAAQKGRPKSKEHVLKVSRAMIGKKRPDLALRNSLRASI